MLKKQLSSLLCILLLIFCTGVAYADTFTRPWTISMQQRHMLYAFGPFVSTMGIFVLITLIVIHKQKKDRQRRTRAE